MSFSKVRLGPKCSEKDENMADSLHLQVKNFAEVNEITPSLSLSVMLISGVVTETEKCGGGGQFVMTDLSPSSLVSS